ncbi:uncharacterized protein LOC107458909 [Arachis duranensis]|uniref:Uncharacterized protein LOC107458909 n=1 Tax=Arachis duranensis TaxID=130453 RepID=A0A6P4BX57_ARADU|nr:uncharacterized protein LOC107458909 [Arachis duranensis]
MAPHGLGRERERDHTSMQKPEINPNNPINLMAVLENMAAAMQATTETLGQQINNNGNGGREAQGLMTLETFLKVNPPKFKGTTNLTEANTWFQAIERALQAQLVLEEQCVKFATYLLTGEASHWWQGTRHLLQQGDDPITWDAIQVEFYKKYFPNSTRTANELELLQLKQGAMSVSKYTDKFDELFGFSRMCQGAPGDFEEWKYIKYEGGLWSDILSLVGPMEIRTFSELVNKSRIAEECMKRRVAEKGSHREHNQGFSPRGRKFKGRGYIQHFPHGRNNFATSEKSQRNGKGKRAAAASDVLSCQICGSHHPNRPCRVGLGVCYKCELPGHVSRNFQQGESQDAGRLRQ